MIQAIEHQGVFIHDCTVAGETRREQIVPAHPNGLQLSKNRWLIIFASRGFRGLDDDRSVIYQLRRDKPEGPIIREGFLAPIDERWDPLGDGSQLVKQCGHPIGFGVPKGALVDGKPAPHANHFAASWRISPRVLDRQRNYLKHWAEAETPPVDAVEWAQFRLNDREDDIEILAPATRLRQKGYESGPAFCSHETTRMMNQSFVVPVPLTAAADQWVSVSHFVGSLAVLKFAFNTATRRYEWVATSPFLNDATRIGLLEGSILPYRGDWLIAGRTPWGELNLAWFRTHDPFGSAPPMTISDSIKTDAPHTTYACADGQVRVFSGDATISPQKLPRCPLYAWDIDPERGYVAGNRRVVFDGAGLPFPPENNTTLDMCKLLPHAGGREGTLLFRVRTDSMNFPSTCTKLVITPQEMDACAIHWAKITYDREYAPMWRFS